MITKNQRQINGSREKPNNKTQSKIRKVSSGGKKKSTTEFEETRQFDEQINETRQVKQMQVLIATQKVRETYEEGAKMGKDGRKLQQTSGKS